MSAKPYSLSVVITGPSVASLPGSSEPAGACLHCANAGILSQLFLRACARKVSDYMRPVTKLYRKLPAVSACRTCCCRHLDRTSSADSASCNQSSSVVLRGQDSLVPLHSSFLSSWRIADNIRIITLYGFHLRMFPSASVTCSGLASR